MNKQHVNYILVLLLLVDLIISFMQHYSMSLDGDMAGGIVPAEDVKCILSDPFGISVIRENAVYPNPNRFFAHWTFFIYFNYVPIWLQSITNPIDSIYLACAIAKIFIQILIMTLLAFYIIGRLKIVNSDFLIASVLVIPLFQTNGYRSYMGIIDPSITYTFFYSLPGAILLLFYLPFYYDAFYGTSLMKNWFVKILVFIGSIYIVFDGALNPGIILTITLLYSFKSYILTDKKLIFINRIISSFRVVPKTHLFFFSLVSLLSLYALYIGKNNLIFLGDTLPISERYSRIPKGLINLVTQKIGFPVLLIVIGINSFLLRRNIHSNEIKKSLGIFNWIGLFALCYILLLPLGGYKAYRPNILRYDTIMPVTIGLIFIYAKSSYELIKLYKGKNKYFYLGLTVVLASIFSYADKLELEKNKCEKLALEKISRSKNKIVFVESDCTVLSWDKITNPAQSMLNGELLKKWNITTENKMYFQNK